ncbi:hypothetical protein TPHA_0N01320 [Tetrapisispora phaffii CBS 4417]|uniref:Clu domain-containing protein n=1 Tax=Tetrapisispora phaffii (strain ATCC 24235 / CBS 4417 / NBRC 1672 / NRRL Y-8282 / UCD 70-5) TaxID=1071381 RepID=G8C185_TETPH|nr:hypothetical protein TPHA_0N01320 [Tetrapisispora phaffii CBS 4417]CCE65913.1 hypothetical protein TPHA_0N01320 [Tetrapisispora phaffii CBS 4417]
MSAVNDSAVKVIVKVPVSHHKKANKKKNPHFDELTFQFSKDTNIQTVLDVLGYAPTTKYFTNYVLKSGSTVLNNSESIRDLVANNSNLNLSIEIKPYNTREALKHVLTLRDFIGFASETEDGISQYSISTGSKFSSIPFNEVPEKKEDVEEVIREGEQERKNVMYVSDEEKKNFEKVVNEIFEVTKNSTLAKSYSSENSLVTPCVNSLNLSAYNPVPAFYKSKGHLLYLQIVTIEGESMHITATPSGFYVNKSNSSKFDPSIKLGDNENAKSHVYYNLFDLLASNSKLFINHVESLEKKLEKHQSIEYIRPLTTFLNKPWLIPNIPTNSPDFSRLQMDSINYESERNFNDEFQAVQELPTSTIQDTIQAEKLLSRISHEFTVAATKGAMSIFNDDMIPLNPDEVTYPIYLKDNIFYSFINEESGPFGDKGGYDAAIAISNQDLNILRLLKNLRLKDVSFVLTTIVDFGGKRLLAQAPVPGVLSNMGTEFSKDPTTNEEIVKEKKSEVVVKYGFDEESGKVIGNETFDKIVRTEISNILHLKSHKINDAEISLSSQSKGIVGSDKRNYILDLANTNPVDVNFIKEHYDNVEESKRYPHRQALLRAELVDNWWNNKVEKEKVDLKKAYEENMFSYNPDAYQMEGVEDPTVLEMSEYLSKEVIPNVVNEYCNGNTSIPYNGEHLTDTLHKNGINVRYLGKIAELSKSILKKQKSEHAKRLEEIAISNEDYENWEAEYLKKIEKIIMERQEKINKYVSEGKEVPKELTETPQLNEDEIRKPTNETPSVINTDELIPLIKIAELEIFSRSAKHVIRKYSRELPIVVVPIFISYVLNLLFGNEYNENTQPEDLFDVYPVSSYKFSTITRSTLLKEISEQAFLRFRYELDLNFIENFNDTPYVVIRAIAVKVGIQLLNKEYFFNKDQYEEFKLSQDKKIRNKLVAPLNTFSTSDFALIPIVKGLDYSSVLSNERWSEGSLLLKEDQNAALTLLAQSIAIVEDVNSVLHPQVAEKYLTLSTIYSKLGLTPEAVVFCRKACSIYERVCGIDSFEMLRALSNLALLEFANECPYNAALVFKRIIETTESVGLTEAIHHPIAIDAFSQLEQMALGIENTKLTIEICKVLRTLMVSLEGNETLAYATLESRLSNLYASISDFQNALEHISKAPRIFSKELGTNHQITAQSRQWVGGLTNLLNEVRNKKKLSAEQAAVNGTPKKSSKSGKKDQGQNPELANKSVDELLDFIEGETSTKKSKGKSKKTAGKK